MTEEQASELCKSCGLCCYAFHNFGYVKNQKEQQIIEKFGGIIFKNNEDKLSFKQPCPAFNGICSIYPNHPSSCKEYQCKLLKSMQNNDITLDKAKEVVKNTKKEVEIIDKSLENLLGKRTETVDNYIVLFFEKAEKNPNLRNNYQKLLLNLGVYTYLRTKYFNFNR